MKKILSWMLTALLAAGLFTGCGTKEESVPGTLNEMDVDSYVKLGDYKELGVAVPLADQIRQVMMEAYHSYMPAEDGITDRVVQQGDGVDIDYQGKKDGVAFDGGTAQGAFLAIGSGSFIAGFEDGLVGVMPGETVDLNLTFPEYYSSEELAGQDVVFTVTVNYIVPEVRDMKDSVVALMGVEEVATVAALQQDVFNYLYVNSSDMDDIKNNVLAALVDQCTFKKLPESMVEDSRKTFEDYLEQVSSHYGIPAEDFAPTYFGLEAEEFAQTFGEKQVRENLALQAVANREGLQVSDEELQSLLEEDAKNSDSESVEEFMGDRTLEEFRNYYMSEKVIRYLISLCPIQ